MEQELIVETRDKITTCFREIENKRMRGIPILNRALSVEVIGLQKYGEEWLCILITPWFMNVMLLPRSSADAAPTPVLTGTKQSVEFPAGRFEMICGSEHGIGPYRMCSLFSPVLEFADQETAVAAANAALIAILEQDQEGAEVGDPDMAMIWRGERPNTRKPNDSEPSLAEMNASPALDDVQHRPSSAEPHQLDRRRLLFGNNKQEKAR